MFDCDGVLADSEGLSSRVVAEALAERGWRISPAECQEVFLGMSITAMLPVIEARVGPLPEGWTLGIAQRISQAVESSLEPIPGALAAVAAVAEAGLPMAVASNSTAAELRVKLIRLGLAEAFGPRVFSFEDVPRPKPAPDIYLAAAASCGAAPEACVVVEDSLLGARAGIAAGCRVLGFARETDAGVLAAVGAEPFRDMAELAGLLGLEP
nr:HAD family phosphatase [Siccirubricoccus soli]